MENSKDSIVHYMIQEINIDDINNLKNVKVIYKYNEGMF